MTHTGSLAVEAVTHRYGDAEALADVSIDFDPGCFVTLLGPSGCGKTTLLRIIAGFLRPTRGRVVLDGRDITRTPAHKRPTNLVFQRPTLFPHLNVAENIAFGLRLARLPRAEIRRRVAEALELVHLEGYEQRRNYELSGGQMQRVALARALVNRPKVLLLDEPLSALDLRIRLELEADLRRVHRETGATFVYVTHDQGEALALSDRIAVFDHGRIEQIGRPADVYRRPVSPYVARFVGDANLMPVDVVETNGRPAHIALAGTTHPLPSAGAADAGARWLVVRPEAIEVRSADGAARDQLLGYVRDVAFRGAGFTYRVDVPGLDDCVKAEVRGVPEGAFDVGARVALSWNPSAASLLERESSP